jgi:hypothetical protein
MLIQSIMLRITAQPPKKDQCPGDTTWRQDEETCLASAELLPNIELQLLKNNPQRGLIQGPLSRSVTQIGDVCGGRGVENFQHGEFFYSGAGGYIRAPSSQNFNMKNLGLAIKGG